MVNGKPITATHSGTATMLIGTHRRTIEHALYSKDSEHTLVPGTLFDTDDYSSWAAATP